MDAPWNRAAGSSRPIVVCTLHVGEQSDSPHRLRFRLRSVRVFQHPVKHGLFSAAETMSRCLHDSAILEVQASKHVLFSLYDCFALASRFGKRAKRVDGYSSESC